MSNDGSVVEKMWAALGLFLFAFGLIIGLPAWGIWQRERTNQMIVRACEKRPAVAVADCVREYKLALK